jgi:poly(A) polymerase/tRNA nucleotidyltransferase (CCA-adding enzyme)
MEKFPLPEPVLKVLTLLENAQFEAFVVGGSVRDLIQGKEPKDWDITTNALPEEIQSLFEDSFYENEFGTVGVKVPRFQQNTPDKYEHDIVEVTTYRSEADYTDARRPDVVRFEKELVKDLSRRDFTINAMAYGKKDGVWQVVDPFNGKKDLGEKILRTVGNPDERFSEDALRLMRAVRLVTQLRDERIKEFTEGDWSIEKAALAALKTLAPSLEKISKERVQGELSKIILSKSPAFGIDLLRESALLPFVLPELAEGIGVSQNLHHIYTVWEHNVRALDTCPSKKLSVRLAALLHDVAKPRTKRGEGYRATFYNHDHVGGRMTRSMLNRLKYPKKIVEKAALLVDQHMFFYNVGEVSEAAVRRLIKRVGKENIDDLMDVRVGDRLGSGVPKAVPYKMRHLRYMIDKVSEDPLSVKMLAIKGTDLMSELCLKPGPAIGGILDVLLAEVLEDPKKNTRELLLARAETLVSTSLEELRTLAKERIEEEQTKDDQKIKNKHWVQ